MSFLKIERGIKPARPRQPRDAPPARVVILDEGAPPHGGRGGPGDGELRGGAGLLAAMGHPMCCNSITTRGASHGSQ